MWLGSEAFSDVGVKGDCDLCFPVDQFGAVEVVETSGQQLVNFMGRLQVVVHVGITENAVGKALLSASTHRSKNVISAFDGCK